MKKPLSNQLSALLCVATTFLACGGVGTPDVPTARDVPTATMDASRDVPTSVDVPTGVDVGVMDVPSLDVPSTPADSGVCPAGRTACAGSGCVDTQADDRNCGVCGVSCGAGRSCRAGMCACGAGTTQCGATCANTLTDTMNCGGCGRACAANQMCVAGVCQLNCPMPNSVCVSGGIMSCVNLQTDPSNCGACGNGCRAMNAMSTCVNGVCAVGACGAGFGDCDRNAANGCEANFQTDAQNCGACNNRCPDGQTCSNGMCRMGGGGGCIGNPQWMPVTCTTADWVWSMNRAMAMTVEAANTAHVLATGCEHGAPQPELGQGMCSLDGTGYVSTMTFTMAGCDSDWYHLGGAYTGDCGGHDGDTYRLLALGPNDCYAY